MAKNFDLKMNSSAFNAYKTRCRSAIRHVLADSEKGRLDEAGFSAYSHRSPILTGYSGNASTSR